MTTTDHRALALGITREPYDYNYSEPIEALTAALVHAVLHLADQVEEVAGHTRLLAEMEANR